MKVNKTYRSLLDKSISSMLSAIELYNKPNFEYRDESFSILAVNAWELLLKAYLLKICKYNPGSIFEFENVIKKNGQKSLRKKPKKNRAGNAQTIGIFEVIKRLNSISLVIDSSLLASIELIVEMRDNAIHFHNSDGIKKQLQELGFACIKNYMNVINKWRIDIDLSKYNFYLMPLAYVDGKVSAESILTDEMANYLSLIENKVKENETINSSYEIAISIDISFKKSENYNNGLPVKFDSNGVPVIMSEENFRKKYPFSYKQIIEKARNKYSNFKCNSDFHKIMKEIKLDSKIYHLRMLDPSSIKSQKMGYYNQNIWKVLDNIFEKK
jgi:hypothetical protein